MTTRNDLRLAVRRRLEDTTVTPLWDDALLHDALGAAMVRYSAWFPAERALNLAVTAGVSSVAVIPRLEQSQIVRVRDARGEVVNRWQEIDTDLIGLSSRAQAWRWWNGTLLLATGATGGTWQIEYRGERAIPPDDITAVEIPAGDEELLIMLASATALQRRAIEDAKRGLSRDAAALSVQAVDLRNEAERLLNAKRRRVS